MISKKQLRRQIIWRCKKIIRDCNETIAQAEAWHLFHPDEEPIDFEDFRVWRQNAIDTLRRFGEETS